MARYKVEVRDNKGVHTMYFNTGAEAEKYCRNVNYIFRANLNRGDWSFIDAKARIVERVA